MTKAIIGIACILISKRLQGEQEVAEKNTQEKIWSSIPSDMIFRETGTTVVVLEERTASCHYCMLKIHTLACCTGLQIHVL